MPALTFRMVFKYWKGARIAIFSYGANGGSADFDYVRYEYGNRFQIPDFRFQNGPGTRNLESEI